MDGLDERIAPLSQAARGTWKVPIALVLLGAAALFVDVPITRALVYDGHLNWADRVLEDIELLGHGTIVALLLLGIGLAAPRQWWMLPRVAAATFGGGILAGILKMTVARCRPFEHPYAESVWHSFRAILPGITAGSVGQSFPSGHAATATGLAAALAIVFPKARWYFAAIAGLVALERVETGSHFLSDALWGAAVGYAMFLVAFGRGSVGQFFDRCELRWSGAVSDDATLPVPVAEPVALPATVPFRPLQTVSIVVPMYNERENVERLYDAIAPVMNALPQSSELVLVDDGSRDGTSELLDALAVRDARVKVIHFRRNFGQTAAMSAGMQHATGDAVVLMDGDLQNDPSDIPKMLAYLDHGYDLVHGWRKDRQDRFLDRRLPSMAANWLISKSTGFPVHDLGCTLKVLRREIAHDLRLYGEMHRFIPILAHYRGAKCVEVVTQHHARKFGTSKYGLSRTFRVLLDLLTVKFLTQHFVSPMKLFGNLGLGCIGLGLLAGLATLAMKLAFGVDMTGNPLLLGSVFSSIVGTQFFCLGALGEVAVRTYFESQDRQCFAIRETVNLKGQQRRVA